MKTHLSCYACGILIGKEHLEPTGHRLEKFTLCGDCLSRLKKRRCLYLGENLYMMPNGDIRRYEIAEDDEMCQKASLYFKKHEIK